MSKPQLVHTKLRHIRREIRYLTGLNLKKTKLRHLETRLRVFLGNYLARYEQINAPFVYRVRPNETPNPYHDVCDLWYPKSEHVKKFGGRTTKESQCSIAVTHVRQPSSSKK